MTTSTNLSATQRIANLEGENAHLNTMLKVTIGQTDTALKNIYEQLGRFGEAINAQAAVLNALVELAGGEQAVKEVMERQQRAAAVEQAEKQRAALQAAVAEGRVEHVAAIDEHSIIEGVEYDAEGAIVPPGYWQFVFQKVVPSLKEAMLGKKVGERVPTAKEGHIFEIVGVWRLVPMPEKPEEAAPPAENPVPAIEEAPSAPSETIEA